MTLRASSLLALASVALLAAPLAITSISSNDIWLHLETGALILERGEVPRAEEYTFTRAGSPIVDHEWLAQVIFALAEQAGGLGALILLKFLLTAATLVLVGLAAVREMPGGLLPEGSRGALAALALVGAALLLATHLFLRPHLFTLLLAAGWPLLLRRSGGRGAGRLRTIALLVALQILWANLHGGFVVGILLAAVHAAGEAWKERKLTSAAALPPVLALSALVNPYGARLYDLVGSFSDPAFRRFIVEWQSPFTSPFRLSALFWVYIAWLAALALGAYLAWRRGRTEAVLSIALFAALSLVSRRHMSLLAVVTAPMVAAAAASIPVRELPAARPGRLRAWAGACVLILAAGTLGVTGVP